MKRKRHTPTKSSASSARPSGCYGEGKRVPEVAKALEISEKTFHRWRNQYGGMKANDAKWLKQLEKENDQLKRIVADKEPTARSAKWSPVSSSARRAL